MNVRIIILLLVTLLAYNCQQKSRAVNNQRKDLQSNREKSSEKVEVIPLSQGAIKKKEISILTNNQFAKRFIGASRKQGEIFIGDHLYDIDNDIYAIKILDLHTGQEKRLIKIQKGDSQAPSMIKDKIYWFMAHDNRYFAYTKNKFMVFDKGGELLRTSLLAKLLFSFDVFKQNGEDYVLGSCLSVDLKKSTRKNYMSLFTLPENRKVEEMTEIDFIQTKFHSLWKNRAKEMMNIFFFSPKLSFVFMDKNLYYMFSAINKLYMHNLDTKQLTVIDIKHLEPLKFSEEDIYKMAEAAGIVFEYSKLQKASGRPYKFFYKQYPVNTYACFLVNAGDNKLGLVTGINIKTLKIRIDFYSLQTPAYLYTLFLPLGMDFIYKMQSGEGMYPPFFIDLDQGIYIYNDLDDKGDEIVKKITFKII